jgi:hypothetical protein
LDALANGQWAPRDMLNLAPYQWNQLRTADD